MTDFLFRCSTAKDKKKIIPYSIRNEWKYRYFVSKYKRESLKNGVGYDHIMLFKNLSAQSVILSTGWLDVLLDISFSKPIFSWPFGFFIKFITAFLLLLLLLSCFAFFGLLFSFRLVWFGFLCVMGGKKKRYYRKIVMACSTNTHQRKRQSRQWSTIFIYLLAALTVVCVWFIHTQLQLLQTKLLYYYFTLA